MKKYLQRKKLERERKQWLEERLHAVQKRTLWPAAAIALHAEQHMRYACTYGERTPISIKGPNKNIEIDAKDPFYVLEKLKTAIDSASNVPSNVSVEVQMTAIGIQPVTIRECKKIFERLVIFCDVWPDIRSVTL